MAGGHSFLRTARLPITAYLHEKGGLNYLMLSENTMSIVVRMTSYISIYILEIDHVFTCGEEGIRRMIVEGIFLAS